MENMRGSRFMALAMAAFAVEDMFIKSASEQASIGTILALFGLGGMLIFMVLTWRRGEAVIHRAMFSRPVLIRSLCEMVGRVSFALAIVLTPLSSASAILQASPLVVILGAALVFRERVGAGRWLAVLLGFVGVLMIIRPGLEAFDPASMFAVVSTLGFAGRDLATRAAPPALSNVQLGVCGFMVLIPSGLLLLAINGTLLEPEVWVPAAWALAQILAAVCFGVLAYNALTIAMRTGEVSVVTPFRYTRLLFAMLLGMLVFGERPDLMTLLGSVLIVVSGLYTLVQSRRRAQPKVVA